jgi:hypothetical protein
MADLAQLDLRARGAEARVRALLEDLAEYHKGIYPAHRLALAVWYAKSANAQEQHLLELFTGLPGRRIAESQFSLLWKAGSEGPPYVKLSATSVDHFSELLRGDPERAASFRDKHEVLYFDKNLLSREILEEFHILTEPPGLMKGWYISANEYAKSNSIQQLMSAHGHARPEIGLVKTEESADFENSRGLLHVEITQRWLPLSPDGIRSYTFYNDQQAGQPVYFLFEGGALYHVLRFEVKTDPEYANRLLGKTRDDRYPEVYLRAVHQPARPAA